MDFNKCFVKNNLMVGLQSSKQNQRTVFDCLKKIITRCILPVLRESFCQRPDSQVRDLPCITFPDVNNKIIIDRSLLAYCQIITVYKPSLLS